MRVDEKRNAIGQRPGSQLVMAGHDNIVATVIAQQVLIGRIHILPPFTCVK
jgi:hypothetical protein